jgi:iron complex outermembrane receptor protein
MHRARSKRIAACLSKPLPRARTLVGAASVLYALQLSAPHACAQTPSIDTSARLQVFDIPAGALNDVLTRFAEQTAISLSFDPADVQGKHSNGVRGTLPVDEGLRRLLEGTGIQSVARTANGYALIQVAAAGLGAPPAVPAELTLPRITVNASAAAANQDFAAEFTSAATRTNTPLFDLPLSVAVVTPAVLKSQQAQSVDDALRNVSGVTISDADGVQATIGGTPYVRGLLAAVMIDGMPTPSSDIALSLPIAALSGIEVIKGAQSILIGSTAPTGVINVRTKQPQADPVREFTIQAGSYGDWLASADLAGALPNDSRFTYRFVVSGEHANEDFFGQDGKHDLYVAPSIGYQSGGTKLVVGLQQHSFSQPLPANTTLLPSGPLAINSPLVDPAGRQYGNATSVFYDLTQHLNDSLVFHSRARYTELKNDFPATYDFLQIAALEPLTGYYVPYSWRRQTYDVTLDNNLEAHVRLGALQQTLLAGFSYERLNQTTFGSEGDIVQAPIPWTDAPRPSGLLTHGSAQGTIFSNTFYLQDQLSWHALRVLASISHGQQWNAGQPAQGAWSPNLGVLYQLSDSVAVYANLQRSFFAQTFPTFDGSILPAGTGRSVEAGLKFDLFDDRLFGTVTAFRASERNVANDDPAHPGFFYLAATGYGSRGVEMDVTGQWLPGWKIIASYTFNTLQSPPNTGITQLPKHLVSLWTTYDLRGERWHGWGAGIGIWARSNYQTADSFGNQFPIPGQVRTDASIYYRGHHWSATLGVKNLFNRRLYADYAQPAFVEVEPTRLFYLTGSYAF